MKSKEISVFCLMTFWSAFTLSQKFMHVDTCHTYINMYVSNLKSVCGKWQWIFYAQHFTLFSLFMYYLNAHWFLALLNFSYVPFSVTNISTYIHTHTSVFRICMHVCMYVFAFVFVKVFLCFWLYFLCAFEMSLFFSYKNERGRQIFVS